MNAYFQRWRTLPRPAQLYLLHTALLTGSLASIGLFFNLAILAHGYPRTFLGELNGVSVRVAVVLSLPLWWLVLRIGLRWGLLLSATLQAASALMLAMWPTSTPLLIASGLSGAAATIFQVSSPPFMMRHSTPDTRDFLFSANTAINIGIAGASSLVAGWLPALFGGLLHVGAESAAAYQATMLVGAVGVVFSLVPLLFLGDRPTTTDDRPTTTDDELKNQEPITKNREPSPSVHLFTFSPFHLFISSLLARVPKPYRSLARHPWPVISLLITPTLISFGAAALIPYLNIFFKNRFLISDSMLGIIFAALGISTGLAALVGPLLSAQIGKVRAIVLIQAISVPFLLAMGFTPLLGVVIMAAVVRAALFNMASPLYDAFAMERTPEPLRPVVIGIINGAYTAGYLIMPELSTWTQERYGFGPLFLFTAGCYGCVALANYALFVRVKASSSTFNA